MARRVTLHLAAVGLLLLGVALPASAQVEPEGPTQAEIEFWAGLFPCPEFPGLEIDPANTRVLLDGSFTPSRTCSYQALDGGLAQTLEISFDTQDDPHDEYCVGREDTRTESNGVDVRFYQDDRSHSVEGHIRLSADRVDLEPAFLDAAAAWMAAAEPHVRVCPEPPIEVACPALHDREVPDAGVSELEPDLYTLWCSYGGTEAHPGAVELTLWWVAPDALAGLEGRACAEEEFSSTGTGLVRLADRAAITHYWIYDPAAETDREGVAAAARDLVAQVETQAISCEGVDTSTAIDPYTGYPGYLASAFEPDLVTLPPGAFAPDSDVQEPDTAEEPSTATTAADDGDDGGAAGAAGDTPGPSASLLSKIITIGALILSIAGLAITFLLIRREARVRPGRDLFRVAVTVAVAVLMVAVFGRSAPVWAVLVALGAGLALGWWQGANLAVRVTDRGVYAKRSALAIVAFAAGIALSLVAGLLNRTGVLSVGIALSFLSAALASGLIAGRAPKLRRTQISGAAVAFGLLAATALVGIAGAGPGQAQETDDDGVCGYFLGAPTGPGADAERCEGHRELIDLVDWNSVGVAGGLWWLEGKPFTEVAVPRALDDAPEPITRTVEWSSVEEYSEALREYEVTETFTFSLTDEGICCSVDYEGTGTKTVTPTSGDVEIETIEAAGRLHDIQPTGVRINGAFVRGAAGIFPGMPFSEVMAFKGQPENSCTRLVAEPVPTGSQDGAWETFVSGTGEAQESTRDLDFSFVIPCDVPGFSYEAALAAAPPPPAADDPAREGCPVLQEVASEMLGATAFDGVVTVTAADVFLNPNTPACSIGDVAFGQGGRGGTRHEIQSLRLRTDDEAAWAQTLADAEDTFFFLFRPDQIPTDERCEVDADGIPQPPPEGETCEVISMHRVPAPSPVSGFRFRAAGDAGVVWIWTDYDYADGPNVVVRAILDGAVYRYRCHHCEPGDPEITGFLSSLNGFSSRTRIEITGGLVGGGEQPAAPATTQPSAAEEPIGTVADSEVATPEGDISDDAAAAALIGLLGSAGLLASALAGTGISSPAGLLDALRRGDVELGDLGPPPDGARAGVMVDEHGEPMTVNTGGWPDVPVGHVWWHDGSTGRWVPPEEAADLVARAAQAEADFLADRAAALSEHAARSDQDWRDLIERSRADAAAAWAEAAARREESQTLIEESVAIRDRAAQEGYDDLLDYLEDHPVLTPEQAAAVYDSMNRRVADQEAIDALGNETVWQDFARHTQEDLAAVFEAAGRPDLAWAVRNPGTTLRVGAAIATGGASEIVAVPLDITRQLHEAQQRSLAEHGRMMSSDELFGEIGTAVAWEVAMEAGGRAVGAGLGWGAEALRAGDEAIEAGVRHLDEAGEAAARQLDEGFEGAARQLDEGFEGAGRQLDEAGGAGARQLDETAGAAAGGQRAATAGGDPGQVSGPTHYDQPLSPRHVDPGDPRYVAPGTPADQIHTPPSDWSQPPPQIIEPEGPLGGRPPTTPEPPPTGIDAGDIDLPPAVDLPDGTPPRVGVPESSGIDLPDAGPPRVDVPDADAPRAGVPEPTPDELLEGARPTRSAEEILDDMMGQPRHPAGPGAGPATVEEWQRGFFPDEAGRTMIDAEGRVVVGGRQIGSVDPNTGMLRNLNDEPVRVALDHRGVPVGYLEDLPPSVPEGMRPAYNARGELAGYVDELGRADIGGERVPVALDARGNLVPFEAPPPAGPPVEHMAPEGLRGRSRVPGDAPPVTGAPDLTGAAREGPPPTGAVEPPSGRGTPVDHTPYGQPVYGGDGTPAARPSDLDTEPRLPVLDENGAVDHLVEPGPREIHYDDGGVPHFVQRQHPVQGSTMRDVVIDPLNPPDQLRQMPTPEVFDATEAWYPLSGDGAPPPAPKIEPPAPPGGPGG